MISACSSNGWLVDDPRIGNRSIYVQPPEEGVFELDEDRLNSALMQELRAETADSLMRSALGKTLRAYENTPQAMQLSDSAIDADVVFEVEAIEIYRVRTLNVVHPGPVFKVEVRIAGRRGSETIFIGKENQTSNLALIAADGARFYIPSDEERMDVGLQRQTIYPVMESVFGHIWQEVVDQNRQEF
ncbi:MAG: hypothetical protein ACOC2C_03890 [Cyclonatronaceae bacterium]